MSPIVTAAGIQVELTDAEIDECGEWARVFMRESYAQGLNPHTTQRRSKDLELEQKTVGMCAEHVFCKWQSIPFKPKINTFHSVPDVIHEIPGVGRYHEIRGTRRLGAGLPIRSNDDDQYLGEPRIYTLVTGAWPIRVMTIHGWARAADAKQDCYKWNPHGWRQSWEVPQHALRKYPDMVKAKFTYPPKDKCHRYLDAELRWCGAEPMGVWQVGPLCEEHSRPARTGVW